MLILIKHFTDFFEPMLLVYEVKAPTDEASQKIKNALEEQSVAYGVGELTGSIEDGEFIMSLISGDMQGTYGAVLKGKLIQKRAGTRMEVYISRDSSTYFTFFLSVIAAIVYLVFYLNNLQNVAPLIGSISVLIIGTAFSVWYSNKSAKTIKEKFEAFLQKSKLTATALF